MAQPERSDGELDVKPIHCQCSNCHHWTTSIDWCPTPHLEFEGRNEKGQRQRVVHPLLKSAQHAGETPKILAYTDSISTKVEKQSACKTLVHGVHIPKPVTTCFETYFHEDVQIALQSLNYKYTLPIQSFVWPALFRQLNVFMISGPKSGKTMAYLPAVCSFGFHSAEKYKHLEKYQGPLVVIVCPNSKQCEEVFDLIKKLYGKIPVSPKVALMTYPITHTKNMDVLITIPDVLVHCIESRIFNLKRLCHLVFENASMLLKNNEENVYAVLNVVNEVLEHRASNTQVQMIVTSEKWTSDVSKLLKSLYIPPLVCIGNYLEAALYGGIKFDIRFLVSQQKKNRVGELLKDDYNMYKTLIVCRDDEMTELNKYLVRNGVETIALREDSNKEERELKESEWSSANSGQYKVLLCTDFILETSLSVNDAVWVIHYSLPDSWLRFCKRFSAQSFYYQSPLNPATEKLQCKSYLLIDETCKKYMPKILNLLRRLTKDFPKSYQEYAESCNLEIEHKKIDSHVELCKTLKLFGKCPDPFCKGRHLLSQDLDASSDLPRNGKLVFKIVELKDVSCYSVQLIKHIDLDGAVSFINDDNLKEPLQYHPRKLKRQANPEDIKPGNFYIERKHGEDSSEFAFCQVLTDVSQNFVEIKFLNGVVAQVLKKNLFELPEDLKIVELYMSNFLPPHKDENFSGRAYHVTRTSLEYKEYKDIVLTADIQLQLNNTFWVHNVVEIAKVGDASVIKFNFTKHLMDLKVVNVCKTQLTNLYKLCETCEIKLPAFAKTVQKTVKTKEIEPQRAFLEEGPNEVTLSSAISPEEFYVRLFKYQDLLENLEKDIEKAVKTEVLDKNVKATIGKHYLAPDPSGKLHARALLLKIEADKALIFYVDYGDEAVVDVSTLKTLPSKLITKLPFQAIQCRLHGLSPAFGEWEDQATDLLYKYMYEPDSDVFRSLFVQMREQEKSDSARTKVKYSVLLKDGFAGGKNILINQFLIDCGFATSIFGQVDDFQLPQHETSSNLDSEISESEEEQYDEEDIDEDIMEMLDEDLEIFDDAEFLEMFCPANIKGAMQYKINQLTNESKQSGTSEVQSVTNDNVQPSTSVMEPSGKLTPEVYWSQTEKIVRLKIKLFEVKEYKANVIHKKMFTFWTKQDENIYELKFPLQQAAELSRHSATGQEVVVVLNKVQPLEWTQLTGGNKRFRYIHYELLDHEKPKPRRKFLQLDISDEESDVDDNILTLDASDLDSDLDYEAHSSSED